MPEPEKVQITLSIDREAYDRLRDPEEHVASLRSEHVAALRSRGVHDARSRCSRWPEYAGWRPVAQHVDKEGSDFAPARRVVVNIGNLVGMHHSALLVDD